MALLPFLPLSATRLHFLDPHRFHCPCFPTRNPLYSKLLHVTKQTNIRFPATVSHSRIPIPSFFTTSSNSSLFKTEALKLHPALFQLAASSIFFFFFFFCFFSFRTQACLACPVSLQAVPSATCQSMQDGFEEKVDAGGLSVEPQSEYQPVGKSNGEDDAEWKAALEKWKSKTYALTVPLRIIYLRGSIPPSWIKDWGDLWRPELAGKISMVDAPREVVGAVLKYMGASYNTKDIESQVTGGRNAAMRNLALLQRQDWGDLWRPELAGKISMVDAPREVVGAVLKYMGASYNTKDIESQVTGGRNAAMRNLALLQRQVRLFDSVHYLKAFGAGDVWVAVGWGSDVIPAAKRLSNVAVIVPKSGASLWADLWAIPAATKFVTNRVGGRVRTVSPLIHQWIEFCLQVARALPFKQEVVPGASPLSLEGSITVDGFEVSTKGKPKLDTNLVCGKPPSEILARCEFLEPLSEVSLMDYQWLISNMLKSDRDWINKMLDYVSSVIQTFGFKLQLR